MTDPDFNYLVFQDLLTLSEYNQAYDAMLASLHDKNQVIRETGQIAARNHNKFPETFANVWKRGFGIHWDVV